MGITGASYITLLKGWNNSIYNDRLARPNCGRTRIVNLRLGEHRQRTNNFWRFEMLCGKYFHKEIPERNKNSYKFHDYPMIFWMDKNPEVIRNFRWRSVGPIKLKLEKMGFVSAFFPMKNSGKIPRVTNLLLMIADKKRRWMYSRSSEEKRFIRKEVGSPTILLKEKHPANQLIW